MYKSPTKSSSLWRSVGRKISAASLVTALAFSFSACEKEKTDVAPVVAKDPTMERILALGFNQKDVEDKGTYYLVEGDIRFNKQAAGTPASTKPGVISQSQDQSHTWELITYDRQANITYRVDPSFPWPAAVQDAVTEWNNIPGCRVHLIPTAASADITFVLQSLNGAYGQGTFPSDGTAGNLVRIDPGTPSYLLKLVLVHELGHNFGFRHTNWYGGGEGETPDGAVVINGTPFQDPNSVMNTGSSPNQANGWQGFSTDDVIAFQNLYPVYATSINNGYYKILNRASNKSIDVAGGGGGDGQPLVQWGDGGSSSEQWYFQSAGDDHYRIINRATGRSIDVSGGGGNRNNGVQIVQWGNGSATSENWRLQDVGSGYYKIVNRVTGKCLDLNGGNNSTGNGVPLVQWYYQGHPSQEWRLAL